MSREVHILFDSQKVKDIKVPANGNDALMLAMGKLRRGLKNHSYIPGEKVPVDLIPVGVNEEGVYCADIPGGELSSDLDTTIHVRFPLGLKGYTGGNGVEEVFAQANGVLIDDGGNIQNGALNTLIAIHNAGLRKLLQARGSDIKITIASSSDPFQRVDSNFSHEMRELADVHIMDVPDRFAIQVPWKEGPSDGTLAFTSSPKKTGDALAKLAEESEKFRASFKSATTILSSDPIWDQVTQLGTPPNTYMVNASSAFRSLVASVSYGRTVVLPMNNGEAADVNRLLTQQKYNEELDKIERPSFPTPLKPNGIDIDIDSVKQLDESLRIFRSYIPFVRHTDRIAFASPITFGADGGILVGTGEEDIVCFTTVPHPEKEERLLEEFGDSSQIDMDRRYEVGAGDAAATIFTLFESIDPLIFIEPFAEDREKTDQLLLDLASTIYVNVLARIAGNFLTRTQKTNWVNIAPDKFRPLFEEAAKESLEVARNTKARFQQGPVSHSLDRWGIQVLTWKLGKVSSQENFLH